LFRIAIIQYPGSNCEHETMLSVRSVGLGAEVFRWNRDPEELRSFDGYVIPGGFSYQDRVRAGSIAAKKPIMRQVMSEAEVGKPVLGICNGAQVLVETGMVPGLNWGEVQMGLATNLMQRREGYYANWARLRTCDEPGRCAFSLSLDPGATFPLPFAHGEGRFTTQHAGLMERLIQNRQVVFAYCLGDGSPATEFPDNPNGALASAAGICNPRGNVLALMPHPERANWLRQVPDDFDETWSERKLAAVGSASKLDQEGPGRSLFLSLLKYLEAGNDGE